MGLFSFFRKNKQDNDSAKGASYLSRSANETVRARNQRTTNEAKPADVPESRRARRRLIGAIVLVLAVVFILPKIFDSEPNPQHDIALQMNDQTSSDHGIDVPTGNTPAAPASASKNVANVTIDNGEEEEIISQPAHGTSSGNGADQPPSVIPPIASSPAPAHIVPPVMEVQPTLPTEQEKAAPAAPAKPEKPVPAKPKASNDDGERALAILEGRTPQKPAAKTQATTTPALAADAKKFVVQVAALTDQSKVAALRQKLSSAGITTYTQKVKTAAGETTRVRVGPFNGRDAAEKMQSKLKQLGLSGTVMPA